MPALLTVIRMRIIPFYVRWCEEKESRFDSGSEGLGRLFRVGLVYLYSWYVGLVGEWEPQNPLMHPEIGIGSRGKGVL